MSLPKANIRELKTRFAQVEKKKLEEWDLLNPKPAFPAAEKLFDDIGGGHFSVNQPVIEVGIGSYQSGHWGQSEPSIDLLEAFAFRSVTYWRIEMAKHAHAREIFAAELARGKQRFLDRILFDFESAYLLLEDFEKWTGGGEA